MNGCGGASDRDERTAAIERWQWLSAIEGRACNAKDGSGDQVDVLAGDILAVVRELRKFDPTVRRPA